MNKRVKDKNYINENKENKKFLSNFFKKSAFKHLLNYKYFLIFIVIFALIDALVLVVSPMVVGVAINEMSHTQIDLERVSHVIVHLFIFYSLYAFSSCIGGYLNSFVTVKITYDIRKDIFDKIGKISLGFVNKKGYGDILSRAISDAEILGSSFTKVINAVVTSLIISIGTVFMMFYISFQMALISVLVLPVVAVTVLIILKTSQKYFKKYQTKLGVLHGFVEESFSEYEIIKVFDQEKHFQKKFKSLNNSMYELSWKSKFFSGLASPAIDFISKIIFVISCIMGGYYVTTAALSLGDIAAFISYSGQFMQPLIGATGIIGIAQQAIAAHERIFEFFGATEEQNCGDNSNPKFNLNEKYGIEFKNLSFGYDESEYAIENFSFEISNGQKIAIVGETGAGKTTLINLLMRFYDNFEGNIFLKDQKNNVINIKDVNLADYRKLFGLVTQDSWLYKGSIIENIRYGNEKASDKEVIKAAEFVGISHFIESLPKEYDTMAQEEAVNISEGEKQLICMARMFLSKAPIFIMDEATSFVDIFTEHQIQKSLRKIMREKTAFIIAHRLNTIKNADVILFMEKGKLLEYGSHQELLAKKGKYYEMYRSQFSR